MKNYQLVALSILTAVVLSGPFSLAEETVGEKIENVGNKTADSVKSTYRKGKDKACEMVDGKMSCVGKKVKNKMKNASDSVGTKVDEVKNKMDK